MLMLKSKLVNYIYLVVYNSLSNIDMCKTSWLNMKKDYDYHLT